MVCFFNWLVEYICMIQLIDVCVVDYFFFKQKTAYEMRISYWRSAGCSSDLLIIENFNKRGRGRKPARERIEAMLERDYAMVKNGNCDYKLTVAYDPDPDGISLDEEIQSLLSEMFNIAESYNCSMEADIYEVGGQQRSW